VLEAAVQSEPATVVSAPKMPLVGGALHDLHSAMGAHIAEQMNLVIHVSREHQGFVEKPLQENERMNRPRHPDAVRIADELPAPSKYLLSNEVEQRRVFIKPSRQSRRLFNPVMNPQVEHAGKCSRRTGLE
jgi:hypothetical protein